MISSKTNLKNVWTLNITCCGPNVNLHDRNVPVFVLFITHLFTVRDFEFRRHKNLLLATKSVQFKSFSKQI